MASANVATISNATYTAYFTDADNNFLNVNNGTTNVTAIKEDGSDAASTDKVEDVAFDETVYEGRGFNLGAGVDIIKYVMENVRTLKTVGSHKDFMTTACPGQYFPLEEMKAMIKRNEEEKEMVYYDWTEDCPEWSRPYVHKALEMGYIKGDKQGRLRLTDDRIWSLVVSMRINAVME